MARITFAALAVLALALAVPAPAQDPEGGFQTDPEVGKQPAWTLGSGRTLWLFPAGHVYPLYIADPHRPLAGAMAHLFTRTGIYDSTDARVGLAMGGRFGLFRLDPGHPGGRSWQFSFDGALKAQFDSDNKNDNVGWDGNYGFSLTTSSGPLALRVGILHTSAHIGDEYAERTGRTRIDYTRTEAAFGVGWRLARGFWVYGEGGYGYYQLTEEQRPWRAQGGLQYTSRPKLLGGRLAWYAAADLSATEERDWRLDIAVQTGLTTTSAGRVVRFGLQYIDGRPPLGEFFQDTEAWITLGIWVDL